MPTYDYKCDACGTQFERFQPITASAIRKCPKCGKLKVRRLIGPGAGLIFKGSGFYITDYRSEGYKSAAKGESGAGDCKPAASADNKPASKDAPKADSKPAPKSESKSESKKK
jgi:putative FmdB family regulatory protein